MAGDKTAARRRAALPFGFSEQECRAHCWLQDNCSSNKKEAAYSESIFSKPFQID